MTKYTLQNTQTNNKQPLQKTNNRITLRRLVYREVRTARKKKCKLRLK